MASSHDVYSAQPAFPFLASSLLAPYDMRSGASSTSSTSDETAAPADRSSWDLKPAFDEFSGLSTYRNESRFLFRCGSTIGFSYLKDWRNTANPDVSRDLLGEVPKRLLARYLLGCLQEQQQQQQQQNLNEPATPDPRVYIIRPSHSPTLAPDALLNAVLEEASRSPQTVLSRDQAIDLLDCVELLTIHDFSAATRAISQVSDKLYAMQQEQRRQQTRSNQDYPLSHEEKNEEDDDNDFSDKRLRLPPTVLFILEGLDALAENVIRNSDALHGSAVLMPALRTLTYLSRSYTLFLSVVVVNTTGLGAHHHHPPPPSRPPPSSLGEQSDLNRGIRNNNNNMMKSAGGLYSVFSRTLDKTEAQDEDDGKDEPPPLLHTLLARTMDQAIDVHLLYQLRKNQALVEVVKDRTGDGLGKWCVWS